jgi:hypothetical protein
MRHRSTTIAAVAAVAVAGSSSAALGFAPAPKLDSVSVAVPAVRNVDVLNVCMQDAGAEPLCHRISTPDLRAGRITANWDLGLRSGVTVTPKVLRTSACGGRTAVGLRVAASKAATRVTFGVKARYAGVDTPRTVASVDRTIPVGKDTAIWACML